MRLPAPLRRWTSPDRHGRLGLRTRLTLIYGGLFLAAGLVLLITTYLLFNQQLTGQLGRQKVSVLATLPPAPGTSPTPHPGQTSPPVTKSQIYVYLPDGRMLSGDDARAFMAEQEAKLRDAAARSILLWGGVALVGVGGVAVGLGWLVADRVLAPLHRVREAAERIAAAPTADRSLHERIALTGPDDEVKDLADAFDTMVERLDSSFAGQRRFVANASHELRTPLALSRAMIELALHRKNGSADLHRLGEDLLRVNDRHEKLINGLLTLAGIDNEPPERRPVDLADVLDHVLEDTRSEAEQAGVRIDSMISPAPAVGDALLLQRLAHNLVENGIRHNRADCGWVRVESGADEDGPTLRVINSGPMIGAHQVPELFEPFRRLDADRLAGAKGSGLGLSIVRSVVAAHHGELHAEPRPGGGLDVTVRLPTAGRVADKALVPLGH
jgi:signal transduction histidine kinase